MYEELICASNSIIMRPVTWKRGLRISLMIFLSVNSISATSQGISILKGRWKLFKMEPVEDLNPCKPVFHFSKWKHNGKHSFQSLVTISIADSSAGGPASLVCRALVIEEHTGGLKISFRKTDHLGFTPKFKVFESCLETVFISASELLLTESNMSIRQENGKTWYFSKE